eukprot:2280104-Pyramimonas_sp.AAC.1
MVLFVQEHQGKFDRLAGAQHKLGNTRWHGVWLEALATPLIGISSGVVVLMPTRVAITSASKT